MEGGAYSFPSFRVPLKATLSTHVCILVSAGSPFGDAREKPITLFLDRFFSSSQKQARAPTKIATETLAEGLDDS